MIIDAHNHPDWYNHDIDKFLRNMKNYNIDKTWLLTWECPKHEYDIAYDKILPKSKASKGPIPFINCLAYAEKYPDKFVLGYAPDPRMPDAIKKLETAIKKHGVKVCGELKLRMMYDNPDAIRMFKFCGDNNLPVIVHIDYEYESNDNTKWSNYWYGGGIEAFERVVASCPDTIFLGHAPGFWAHISGDHQYKIRTYPEGKVLSGGKIISLLDKYPNLYCDISAKSGWNALNRDKVFAKNFLTKYQDRILYARDYFDNIHQELIGSLGLSNDVLDKIYFKNANKLIVQK